MLVRRTYLAKYRTIASQRAHFAIFIPSEASDRASMTQDYKEKPAYGTIIHVVGEPLMSGYAHEFKRNYEASTDRDLSALILLGTVDVADICESAPAMMVRESTPRGRLEREAIAIAPPPKGQDVRAAIDGVSTFDERNPSWWRQEWLKRSRSRPEDAKNGRWNFFGVLWSVDSSTRKLLKEQTRSVIRQLIVFLGEANRSHYKDQ